MPGDEDLNPTTLWASSEPPVWTSQLEAYRSRIESHGKAGLGELDAWLFEELPDAIRAREEPHITRDELVRLVEWKLKRGKFRPRLLNFAKAQNEEAVRKASTLAYKELNRGTGAVESIRRALEFLCELKGVGPATASALLTVYDPSCPFMSDEALAVASNSGSKDYSTAKYLGLVEELQAKALELGGNEVWTPQRVEMAIYSCSLIRKTAKVTGAKRKRSK